MTDLAVGIIPLTEYEELYRYAQAIVAVYELLGQAENEVGYPSGPSEAGYTTGGGGPGDLSSKVYRTTRKTDDGEVVESSGISDAEVKALRAILKREARYVQRTLSTRTPRLYRELGWRHPNLDQEIAKGHREGDGRLRVVTG